MILFLTQALVLDSFPYQSLKLEHKFRLTALGLQTLNANYFYQTIISFKIKIYQRDFFFLSKSLLQKSKNGIINFEFVTGKLEKHIHYQSLEKDIAFLPGKSQGQKSLVGVHGFAKSWTRLKQLSTHYNLTNVHTFLC